MSILDFQAKKEAKQKISMVTCYDASSAKIISQTNVDGILVGDSVAMAMHGMTSTLPASIELMALHTESVARGLTDKKLLVADLPFMSYRQGLTENVQAAARLMKAGANALKLEGARGNLELVRYLVDSGIPIQGHLGLTPQSIHQLGGFKVQGKNHEDYDRILKDCLDLEKAGCFSVVLECVPSKLAAEASKALKIPVIGIGAGSETDGQILVWHDVLGLNEGFKPKFLRTYLNAAEQIKSALNAYDADVKSTEFPLAKESYN